MRQYELGLEGERLAEDYLRLRGFRVLARRYRSPHGEIDLVASKGRLLYFVEVKYRRAGRLGEGLMGISPQKRAHLKQAIRHYLQRGPRPYRLAYLEITRAGILFKEDVLHEN
ncbi:MAG: YraN family protein [Clostridiales bacterium]|nr:YraN family protein [Clostridiales bacterium]